MEENINGTESLDYKIIEANKEISDELQFLLTENIKTYSRDWTVETIANQISQGSIDLNPKFQRRNAWNDEKRSRLIESLIFRLPIPEVVLAESSENDNKFIILDGKQRLLTIMGFMNNEEYMYWDKPLLNNIKFNGSLNKKSWDDFMLEENKSFKTALLNADIRCTIVFNQKSDDILYEIFYRLNSGAVPLSMQELRQSLRKGEFSNFLVDKTNTVGLIHKVLGIDTPDKRLLDAEFLLKFISYRLFLKDYSGNLKKFLDNCLVVINKEWVSNKDSILKLYDEFNDGINRLEKVFGLDRIGRYVNSTRFNRNIFDLELFYFSHLDDKDTNNDNIEIFKGQFEILCKNQDFIDTLVSSTTSKKNLMFRFSEFQKIINLSFNKKFSFINSNEF
jgi:hypothetical protein